MDTIVTGGAGFIGHHLVSSLVKSGHKVTVIDDLSTGDASRLPKDVDVRIMDCTLTAAYRGLSPDFIYHLACAASPPKFISNHVKTLRDCYVGTVTALEQARASNARFLLTSTSEIYGDPLEHPQREDYNGNVHIHGERGAYDNGKRVAESLCYAYRNQYGVDAKVCRIFNTYGPGMLPDDGRVISNFIRQSLNGEPLTIYGDGKQTRSFCYVQDTVDALMALMHSDIVEPINIGNPAEITINELANTVYRLVTDSNDCKVVNLPPKQHDPLRRRPDITKAKEMLYWQPKTKLFDGLTAMIIEQRYGQLVKAPNIRIGDITH